MLGVKITGTPILPERQSGERFISSAPHTRKGLSMPCQSQIFAKSCVSRWKTGLRKPGKHCIETCNLLVGIVGRHNTWNVKGSAKEIHFHPAPDIANWIQLENVAAREQTGQLSCYRKVFGEFWQLHLEAAMELMQLLPHDFHTSRDVVSVLAQRLIAMALHIACALVIPTSMPLCNHAEMSKPVLNAVARLLEHLKVGVLPSFLQSIPKYVSIQGYCRSDKIHDAFERSQRYEPVSFPGV